MCILFLFFFNKVVRPYHYFITGPWNHGGGHRKGHLVVPTLIKWHFLKFKMGVQVYLKRMRIQTAITCNPSFLLRYLTLVKMQQDWDPFLSITRSVMAKLGFLVTWSYLESSSECFRHPHITETSVLGGIGVLTTTGLIYQSIWNKCCKLTSTR